MSVVTSISNFSAVLTVVLMVLYDHICSPFFLHSTQFVLNVQLVLVKLQLELSFKSSSKKRELGLGLEVKSWNMLLNLRVNLNKLVGSLLELNLDAVALGVG